jgi:uncharacterized Fe-S cluster-containing MiaB family protein
MVKFSINPQNIRKKTNINKNYFNKYYSLMLFHSIF